MHNQVVPDTYRSGDEASGRSTNMNSNLGEIKRKLH